MKKCIEVFRDFWRQRLFALILVLVLCLLAFAAQVKHSGHSHEIPLVASEGGAEPCGEIVSGRTITQPFQYCGSLSGIRVEMGTYARKNEGTLFFKITDESENDVLVANKCPMSEIKDNCRHLFDFGREVCFQENHRYSFTLCGTEDCRSGNAVTCWVTKTTKSPSYLDNGRIIDSTLIFGGIQHERVSFNVYYVVCVFGILLFSLFGDRFLLNAVQRPERVFLLLGLTLSAVFLIFSPPLCVEDAMAHLLRSYQIGDGRFLEKTTGQAASSSADAWINTLWHEEHKVISHKTAVHERYGKMVSVPYNFGHFGSNHPAKNYTPFAYIPQSAASFVARTMNVSLSQGVVLTSIVCVLAYLLCVYLVIVMVPCCKWFFLLLALMPTIFMHGISFSADSGIICFSFLFFGLFLRLSSQQTSYTWRELLALAVVSFAFCQCKFVYFPCLVVLFFLPPKNFGSLRKYWVYVLGVGLVSIICGYLWNKMVSAGNAEYAKQVSERMSFVMAHPLEYLKIWGKVLFSERSIEYAAQSVQTFGGRYFLKSGKDNFFVFDSFWMIYAGVILSSLIALKGLGVNVAKRLVSLCAFVGSVSLIYLVFYAVNPDFTGIQGRYFVPAFPLLGLILGQGKIGLSDKMASYYKGCLVIWLAFTQVIVAVSLLYTYWT